MPRFLRRPSPANAGRTEFQLSLPYPGNVTPEGIQANFRALEQWGNRLPIARNKNFVPYLVQGASIIEESPTFTLSEMWQAKYGTDIVPAGTWLVWAWCAPDITGLSDIVTIRVRVDVNDGDAASLPTVNYAFAGNFTGQAIRVVKDIDFVTPEVTYEWVLPTIGSLSVPTAQTWALCTIDGDGGITVSGGFDYETITDPDVGPELSNFFGPCTIGCIAYRLTDGYDVPSNYEDVTP